MARRRKTNDLPPYDWSSWIGPIVLGMILAWAFIEVTS